MARITIAARGSDWKTEAMVRCSRSPQVLKASGLRQYGGAIQADFQILTDRGQPASQERGPWARHS